MADCLYLRYLAGDTIECPCPNRTTVTAVLKAPACEALWIEWKKLGGKASPHQLAWIAHEEKRGALVWLAGEDFPATIEGFQAFYRAWGLLRRAGL